MDTVVNTEMYDKQQSDDMIGNNFSCLENAGCSVVDNMFENLPRFDY